MVFLKDQIQETKRFAETSVLEWDELPLETNSVRSVVSNSPLKDVNVINVREGFYIQFDEININKTKNQKFNQVLENEKFVYRYFKFIFYNCFGSFFMIV